MARKSNRGASDSGDQENPDEPHPVEVSGPARRRGGEDAVEKYEFEANIIVARYVIDGKVVDIETLIIEDGKDLPSDQYWGVVHRFNGITIAQRCFH
jgi:hypothetical protein